MKYLKFIVLFFLFLIMYSCSDGMEGYNVVFLGDHQVRNWNIEESFPELKAKNYGGKQSSGLEYLSNLKAMYENKDAVVMLGNHDLTHLAEEGPGAVNAYCDKFISNLQQLGCNNIYVYSFLPQNYSNETSTIRLNKFIIEVNSVLGNKVKSAGMVYIDAHKEFYKGYTINPEYTEANGETYNKTAYGLLSTLLKSVYK